MEKTRYNLKITSICILLVTAFRLVSNIFNFFNGGLEVTSDMIPEGYTKEMVYITLVVMGVISLLALLPSIYMGIKGLKIAKNPDTSKAHIVWAMILLVLTAISILSAIGEMAKSADLVMDILGVAALVCSGLLYGFYYWEAKQIRANC